LLTEKIPHLGREKVFAILGNFYLQKTSNSIVDSLILNLL